MREIKFRCWNKELGTLGSYVLSIYITMDMNGALWYQDETMENPTEVTARYIIEQYTGLKDKNGRLIYEGDVMETDNRHGKLLWRIAWEAESCAALSSFYFETINHSKSSVHARCLEEAIVVGNIHENPELEGRK